MMLKLTLRGLAAHRTRMALTAIAVVLGTGFVSGTLIFSATLDSSIDQAFAELGAGTDVVVRARKTIDDPLDERSANRPVPGSLLKTVAGVPGVAKAAGTVEGFAAVVDRKGKVVGAQPQTGMAWNDDRDLSRMRLTAGRAPRTGGDVAVDENTAQEAGVRPGDRVTVALQGGSRPFTLTGIFKYGESSLASSVSVAAFDPATAQRLLAARPGAYTAIVVHADRGVSQQRLRDAIGVVLPAGTEAVTGTKLIEEAKEPIDDVLGAMGKILLAFALIAVFVGSFIIFNTFSMLVAQRVRELALLRAVGAARAQVTRAVLGEALGVGLAGSTLGLATGFVVARLLGALLSAVFGGELPLSGVSFPAAAPITAYAVGVLVTLAAAYLPARRAAKIPPVAAMRDEPALPARSLRVRGYAGGAIGLLGVAALVAGFARSGDTALKLAGAGALACFVGVTLLSPIVSRPATAVLGWPFARFFGTTGRMGRQNARRNPRRTAATAAALMIGLALIGTVSVVTASMAASVDRQLDAGLTADYQVAPSSHLTSVGPPVLDAVSRVPGVRTAVPVRTVRLKLRGKTYEATTGRPARLAEHYRLKLETGAAGGLLVDRATAASNGWRAGTAVPVEYQDGAHATLRVAGVYANVKTFLPTVPSVIVDAALTAPHYPGTDLDHIDVTGTPAQRALDAALAPWPNVQAKDRETIKKESTGGIRLVLRMSAALLLFSVLIAALGIVNTLALSVVERTREIGLLRAIGMQRRQLRRMVRYEAVLISTFGALLGLAIGVVFGTALQHGMAGDGVDVLAVPYTQLGLYVLAAALIGVLAAIWPARRAARMDILQAIAAS